MYFFGKGCTVKKGHGNCVGLLSVGSDILYQMLTSSSLPRDVCMQCSVPFTPVGSPPLWWDAFWSPPTPPPPFFFWRKERLIELPRLCVKRRWGQQRFRIFSNTFSLFFFLKARCYGKDLLSRGNVIFVLTENFHYWTELSKCFCCCWVEARLDCISPSVSPRLVGIGGFPPHPHPPLFSQAHPVLHEPFCSGY